MRLRIQLAGAALLALALSGCAEDAVPDIPQARDCDAVRPPGGTTEADDGDGTALVPTDVEPVAVTVCTFPIGTPGSPPTTRAYSGDEVRTAVDELNGFPPLQHPEDHLCNAAMWPGYVLLIEHRDGRVTTLTADRSCGLVSDGSGAVRIGLPGVVAES